MEKTLSGIKCDVKNCVHHTENNECSASSIHVVNHMARCEEETACKTFSSCCK